MEPGLSFCDYIRKAAEEDVRPCPNNKCDNQCTISHYLTSQPEVFSVSIAWDSPDPPISDIQTVLRMIDMSIDIGNIFAFDGTKKPSFYYRLRGMICYYGKHYIAFFFNYARKQWFYFDDSTVKMVGTEWSDIQNRCTKGHLQPSVLFYECEQPVNTSQVLDKLVQDLSHIKISTIIPKEVEPEELTPEDAKTLAVSMKDNNVNNNDNNKDDNNVNKNTANPAAEQSFIFIPNASKLEQEQDVDFVVTRTNWLYRRQVRIFRFSDDCFKRLLPSTGEEKNIFDYKDVLDITILDNNNIVINFYSGKESQYIQSDQVKDMIDVIVKKAKGRGHNINIKRTK